MKKGFYYKMRTSLVMASLAILMFSTASCWPFCDCGSYGAAKNEQNVKRHQEKMAQKSNPRDIKTGVFLTFKEESITRPIQVVAPAPVSAPAEGYKDFSFRYAPARRGDCPLSKEGSHTFITAGPNINFKNAGDDVYENGSHKPGFGFQLGFQTVSRLNEKFSVVSGLIFKQNNAKEVAEIVEGGEPPYNTSYKIEDKYTYNYLSMPILAQYNLTQNLSVSAGPEVNYLLSAKVKSNISMAGNDHSEKRNISDESVRLGLGVQAGVKYEIPDSRWSMELLYDHRLSRLNKKHPDGYPNYTVPAWKMKSVQLSAKVRICDLVKGPKHENTGRGK